MFQICIVGLNWTQICAITIDLARLSVREKGWLRAQQGEGYGKTPRAHALKQLSYLV